MLGNSH